MLEKDHQCILVMLGQEVHHLVYEVVDNSIDEAMAGYCSSISIEINNDSSLTVEDDGRGIPVGMQKKVFQLLK